MHATPGKQHMQKSDDKHCSILDDFIFLHEKNDWRTEVTKPRKILMLAMSRKILIFFIQSKVAFSCSIQ